MMLDIDPVPVRAARCFVRAQPWTRAKQIRKLRVMTKHVVSMRVENAIPVGRVDVQFPVKVDGTPLGRLKISQGGIDWLPSPNSKTSFTLTWTRLAEMMELQGRKKRH